MGIGDHLKMGIFLGLVGIIVNFIAYRFHFFSLKSPQIPPPTIRHPIVGGIVYLLIFFLSASVIIVLLGFIFPLLKTTLADDKGLLLTFALMSTQISLIIFLLLYSFSQEKQTIMSIWKSPSQLESTSILKDCAVGVLVWIISFPVVISLSQFIEVLNYLIFGTFGEEQMAVRYFKLISTSPHLLTFALISIVILAPIIEELVFRGFLQTYLKQKVNLKFALIISSACFSLLHIAPSQGVGNITLVISLFVLSLYLGFLYEKKHSLYAPIALHMTFNSISVIRILLFSN